jgi:hypothetical protein
MCESLGDFDAHGPRQTDAHDPALVVRLAAVETRSMGHLLGWIPGYRRLLSR